MTKKQRYYRLVLRETGKTYLIKGDRLGYWRISVHGYVWKPVYDTSFDAMTYLMEVLPEETTVDVETVN